MVKKTLYGIVSFVFSLIGLIGLLIIIQRPYSINGGIPLILSILAIVFGAIQKKKGQTKLGKYGLIMGIIGIILWFLSLAWIIIIFSQGFG